MVGWAEPVSGLNFSSLRHASQKDSPNSESESVQPSRSSQQPNLTMTAATRKPAPPRSSLAAIFLAAALLLPPSVVAELHQFNGGSVLAMAGRDAVAIALDARFGLGMQTISIGDGHHEDTVAAGTGNPRILRLPNSNALLAWSGLYGDGIGFAEEINLQITRKVRRAGRLGFPHQHSATRRRMSPRAVTMLMSHVLYHRRNAPYYVEPVVVGLETVRVPVAIQASGLDLEHQSSEGPQPRIDSKTSLPSQLTPLQSEPSAIQQTMVYKTMQKPYLCGTDMLGAQSTSPSFVCSGVSSRSLYGTAEALWTPDLEAEELVRVCGKAFVSALERDCFSGYGAVIYLMVAGDAGDEDDVKIIEYVLACRND